MNERESTYLCVGCVAFCVIAIPMMWILSLRQPEQKPEQIEPCGQDEQASTLRRSLPPAPPSENASTHYRRMGAVPLREGIQIVPAPAVHQSVESSKAKAQEIDIDMLKQSESVGFELKFRISNRSDVSLKMVSVALDFYGDDGNVVSSGEASCFYLEPGQSKIVTAFPFDSSVSNIRNYQLRLDKVISEDDSSGNQFRLNVNRERNLPCG